MTSYSQHFITILFQISDYPEIYRECTVVDQKLLAIFKVDTGTYSRQQFGYRKRTAAAKLKVDLPLVEERLQLLVRISTELVLCLK